MKKLVTVFGMTCESCRRLIIASLEKIEGIDKVTIKLSDRLVEVEFDDQIINLNKIRMNIKELGYDPL